MFTLRVQDFGPIAEGTVTLRPLTVLIGPNNAGKSYLALLTYAACGAFNRPLLASFPAMSRALESVSQRLENLPEEAKHSLAELNKRGQPIRFGEFSTDVQRAVYDAIRGSVPEVVAGLSQELQRGFATKLSDLSRMEATNGFHLWFEQAQPSMKLALSLHKGDLGMENCSFDISSLTLPALPRPDTRAHFLSGWFFGAVAVWFSRFQAFDTTSYYLPAARSGILQGHKALASFILSRVPLAGIEPLQVPTLSGVVADFLANILRIEKGKADPDIAQVAAFLEEKACGGTVDIGATEARFEYPEIYYEIMGSKLPLHRTSSMVSEMAPIILFLKYVVKKGNLLIIEEPEAHLHPDNQRTLARAMVRLIRQGVRLIITTHSEYLLHQISNFILLAEAEGKRLELGYSENEYLRPEEVGSYLFSFGKHGGGSQIKELEVTEEDGIPEDEFVRIAEALYNETLSIERALPR